MFKQPNFNKVLVLDTNRKPLMPCYPARARKLLSSGRASVFRRYPFTVTACVGDEIHFLVIGQYSNYYNVRYFEEADFTDLQ